MTQVGSDGTPLGGRYQLGERLGSGGMADVYRAEDLLLHRPVAVKVLRTPTVAEDAARFTSEGRTLAPLSHPGLVMLLDAGSTPEEHPYLVMQLVEGPTLAELLHAGPVPLERVRVIGVRLAEALAYAHEAGVVHRDVKPGNVLVPADGEATLTDFGIAHLIGSTIRHTLTGTAIGTAAYLAPEQVTAGELTGAVDVYALGLVLLEAITRERAYPGTPAESATARLHRPPAVPAGLPAPWPDLLTRMTALDPAARPSAAEVAATLRGAAAASSPGAPDPAAVTQVLTAPVEVTPAAPAWTPLAPTVRPLPPRSPAGASPVAPAGRPAIDRAGDQLGSAFADVVRRAREVPEHLRMAGLALAAILLLLLIAGLVGR